MAKLPSGLSLRGRPRGRFGGSVLMRDDAGLGESFEKSSSVSVLKKLRPISHENSGFDFGCPIEKYVQN